MAEDHEAQAWARAMNTAKAPDRQRAGEVLTVRARGHMKHRTILHPTGISENALNCVTVIASHHGGSLTTQVCSVPLTANRSSCTEFQEGVTEWLLPFSSFWCPVLGPGYLSVLGYRTSCFSQCWVLTLSQCTAISVEMPPE